MKKCNLDIRTKAMEKGIPLWKIAQACGVSDANFSRKLRNELPKEEKDKILFIIESLSEVD